MTAQAVAEVRQDLDESIRALTVAARRTDVNGDPRDFAGFLAHVVAAVAANVGGPDILLAGRPGSWEASLVADLIRGTVGDGWDMLARLRTEPVKVTINVAELIESDEQLRGLVGLEDALAAVDRRYSEPEDDEPPAAYQQEVADTIERYTLAYRAYAADFSAAVSEAARDCGIPDQLVVIQVDDNPMGRWWVAEALRNPSDWRGDPLAFRLWSQAYAAVPLPEITFPNAEQPSAARSANESEGAGS